MENGCKHRNWNDTYADYEEANRNSDYSPCVECHEKTENPNSKPKHVGRREKTPRRNKPRRAECRQWKKYQQADRKRNCRCVRKPRHSHASESSRSPNEECNDYPNNRESHQAA